MSALLSAAASAAPLAAGWSVHTLWMRRRLVSARRDPLTGLLTRDAFTARAARLLRTTPLAVLVIDLDGFKEVNDRYGHAAGDAVLAEVAARLRSLAVGGFAGRLGGDEFAAVVQLRDRDRLKRRMQRVHGLLCEPVAFEDRRLSVGASVGGIWSGDLPVSDLSAALRRADEAMYDAKRTGGGWLAAQGPARVHNTVNSRRAGRDGAHLSDATHGGEL